jgi:hypothetical protein
MSAPERSGVVLLDGGGGDPVAAPWAGGLLALGARLARQPPRDNVQLIVAVSLPARDFAAVLIAAGWLLARPAKAPLMPIAVAEGLQAGTPVRMIAGDCLVADRFFGVDRARGEPRIHVGWTWWRPAAVTCIAADSTMPEDRFGRLRIPSPGTMATWTGYAEVWAAEQCCASSSVVVLGRKSRLLDEMELRAGWTGLSGQPDRLVDLIRPDDGRRPAWASTIVPAGLGDLPEFPDPARLAVLDGATAIRWLAEVATPMVVALLDRSAVDDAAGDMIMQARSAGVPIPLSQLGWHPFAGMEALAFEVRS